MRCLRSLPEGGVRAQSGAIDTRYGCEADVVVDGTDQGDHLGHALRVGDFDDDGFDDLLSGDLRTTAGHGAGEVWLFLGGPNGLASTPHLTVGSLEVAPGFAPGMAFGDVDEDGKDDLIIGANRVSTGPLGPNHGEVLIFLAATHAAGGSVTPAAADVVITPPTLAPGCTEFDVPNNPSCVPLPSGGQAHFGFSVDIAGDVNGDTYVDLVIGAPGPINPYRAGEMQGVPVCRDESCDLGGRLGVLPDRRARRRGDRARGRSLRVGRGRAR